MIKLKSVEIKQEIYWVGGIDWDIKNFHGYLTPRGTTYNAYLILDDKITLVDTVKHYLFDEMLSRIGDIIEPSDISISLSKNLSPSSFLPPLAWIFPMPIKA